MAVDIALTVDIVVTVDTAVTVDIVVTVEIVETVLGTTVQIACAYSSVGTVDD